MLDFEIEAIKVINYLSHERTRLLEALGAATTELASCRQQLADALASSLANEEAASAAREQAAQEALTAENLRNELATALQRMTVLEQAIATEQSSEASALDAIAPFLQEINDHADAPEPTPEPAPEPVAEQPAPEPVAEQPAPESVAEQPAPEPVAEQPAPEPVAPEPVIPLVVQTEPATPQPEPVAEVDPLTEEPIAPEVPETGAANPAELPVMPEGVFDVTPEPVVTAEQEQAAIDAGAFTAVEPTTPPAWEAAAPADPAEGTGAVGPGNEPLIP